MPETVRLNGSGAMIMSRSSVWLYTDADRSSLIHVPCASACMRMQTRTSDRDNERGNKKKLPREMRGTCRSGTTYIGDVKGRHGEHGDLRLFLRRLAVGPHVAEVDRQRGKVAAHLQTRNKRE